VFRDPVHLTFVDEDNRELHEIKNPQFVPRVGENVRLRGNPYVVARVGYDLPDSDITRVWVVCDPT